MAADTLSTVGDQAAAPQGRVALLLEPSSTADVTSRSVVRTGQPSWGRGSPVIAERRTFLSDLDVESARSLEVYDRTGAWATSGSR